MSTAESLRRLDSPTDPYGPAGREAFDREYAEWQRERNKGRRKRKASSG